MTWHVVGGIVLTALGSVASAYGLFLVWNGQQDLLRQASAKPVIDAYVDKDKVLRVENRGTVGIEDLTVDATTYTIEADEKGNPLGLGRFSKPSAPIWSAKVVPARVGAVSFQITGPHLPIYDTPRPPEEGGPLPCLYVFRVLMRNAVTKQRLVKYVVTGPVKGFPSVFDDLRETAMSAPVSSKKIDQVRAAIRDHQAALFDDDPATRYRD